jgi:predicted enzyme related to lactoylglutathione lyase
MTTDPEAAVAFYKELIGWGTTQWEEGEMPYEMWTVGESAIGGVMALPPEAKEAGAPPHWMAYVSAPDTDATTAEAVAKGAEVLVPAMDIPTVGRFSVIRDPQGAVLALFTPAGDAPGHEGPAEVGEFSWHELAATDQAQAFPFYQGLFGWEAMETLDVGAMGSYQVFGRAGLPLGGMFNKGDAIPGPPFWLFYIRVDDVAAAVARVEALGGQVLNGPMEVPGGDTVAQCCDPQGAAFALHSVA